MKLKFDKEERRLTANQLYQLAIQAAELGDRKLHRELMRLANKFADNAIESTVHRYEATMLLDLSNKTLITLETEVIPRIEKSDKSEDEKTKSIDQAKEIMAITATVIEKLKEKLNAAAA